jgi:plasmid maintenance system killer protein
MMNLRVNPTMAILSFRNRATEDINYGRRSKAAIRLLQVVLHDKARIKLARLHAAESLNDMATLPGNRLEKLIGDRDGRQAFHGPRGEPAVLAQPSEKPGTQPGQPPRLQADQTDRRLISG